MATLAVNPTADGYTVKTLAYSGRFGATFAAVVTSATATSVNTTGGYLYLQADKSARSAEWSVGRPVLYFDLSSMPSGASISAATLTFYVHHYDVNDLSGNRLKIYLWDESTAIDTTDYDAFDTNYTTTIHTGITGTGANQVINIDSTLLSWLQANPQGDGSNNFPIILRNIYDFDYASLSDPSALNTMVFRSNDYTTSSDRPVLTITYTTGYTQKVLGVAGNKVLGIAAANIDKVNEV